MITNIIVLSLIIFGISALFDEGMLLERVGKYLWNLGPVFRIIITPLILCPPCMASVWGTAASLYLGYDVAHWLMLVFATAGLNYIIANK